MSFSISFGANKNLASSEEELSNVGSRQNLLYRRLYIVVFLVYTLPLIARTFERNVLESLGGICV